MVVHAKSKKEMREGETETHRDKTGRERNTQRDTDSLILRFAWASQAPITELQLQAEEQLGLPWSPSGFSLPVGFILS